MSRGAMMISTSINDLLDQSKQLGITQALEAMTAHLERRYADQLFAFEAAVDRATTIAQQDKIRRDAVKNFIANISADFPQIIDAPELAAALVHKSAASKEQEIFRVFENEESAKFVYELTSEQLLIDFVVAEEIFTQGMVSAYGVPYADAAISFLRRGYFIHRYWQSRALGPILSDVGVEKSIRYLTLAYSKFVGAIQAKFGVEVAKQFVLRTLNPIGTINAFHSEIVKGDPKTFLQEYLQSIGSPPSKYVLTRVEGTSDHEPSFTAEVVIPAIGLVTAVGSSKHAASMKVAEQAVIVLARNPKTNQRYNRFLNDRASRHSTPKRRTFATIPSEVIRQKELIDRKFSVSCDPGLLLEAVTSVDLATQQFIGYKNNGNLCFMGSKLIEALLEECGARQASVRMHPTLLDNLEPQLGILAVQQSVFGRKAFHGADRRRDAVQAVLYVAYLGGRTQFRDWFFAYVSTNWHKLSADLDMIAASSIRVDAFDAKFSYVQALQEYTQSIDKTIPLYKDIKDMKNPHAPTHNSIVMWRNFSGKGKGSRTSWSRNMAAWELLRKLKAEGLD